MKCLMRQVVGSSPGLAARRAATAATISSRRVQQYRRRVIVCANKKQSGDDEDNGKKGGGKGKKQKGIALLEQIRESSNRSTEVSAGGSPSASSKKKGSNGNGNGNGGRSALKSSGVTGTQADSSVETAALEKIQKPKTFDVSKRCVDGPAAITAGGARLLVSRSTSTVVCFFVAVCCSTAPHK